MVHRSIVLMLCALVWVGGALAQSQPTWGLDEGSVVVAGSASYYESAGEVQSFSTAKAWDLFPSVYYCVWPNVGVGGSLLLRSETRSGFESNTLAGLGPGILAYFADSSATVYPFIGLNLFYAFLSRQDLASSSGTLHSLSGFALELSLGGTYMLNRYVGITGMLYYQGQQLSESGDWKGGRRYGYRIGVTGFIF